MDLDPVLLEVGDLVAANLAARAIDVDVARPRWTPVNGTSPMSWTLLPVTLTFAPSATTPTSRR